MEKLKLKVGDELFIVRRNCKNAVEAKGYSRVEKVGTKFFYIGIGASVEQIPLDKPIPIHFDHCTTIYRSKEEWEDIKYRRKLVQSLNCITRSKLHDIPLEKLKEVAEILELEIKED